MLNDRTACAHGCTHDDDTPRLAADGLRVCARCENRARKALSALPGLWADLGDTRVGWRAHSGSTGRTAPQPLTDDRRNARSAIRACLVSWCMVLHEDFQITLPADTVRAMAHCVAVQAGRLLASEHADQLVSDLCGFDDEGRWVPGLIQAQGLLETGQRRGVTVPCPTCGERVNLDPDIETIECHICGEWGVIGWWRERVVPGLDERMTAEDIETWMLMHHRIRLDRVTLRQWAAREIVTVEKSAGCQMFDPVEVAAIALERRMHTA